MIASGLVEVNGKTVTELGTKADPERDHIRVNGKLLHRTQRSVYVVMNKPKGYVTTVRDPEGRPTVMDLVHGIHARIYPVGRLDYASEGLLLLTNDGELANRLMKAASHVPKVYLVKISGKPDEAGLGKIRNGLMITEGNPLGAGDKRRVTKGRRKSQLKPNDALAPAKGGVSFLTPEGIRNRKAHRVQTAPAKVRLIREADNPWYEVTLTEGKNRQIRRMFEEIGHHVEKIKRVRYGPLALDVPPGEFRHLTLSEIHRLKSVT